jgi:sugar phosphate isomerase/epimerase
MTLPPLALVLDALPGPVPTALARAAALGYEWVELSGVADRPAADLDALADSGLLVAGIELTAMTAGPSASLLAILAEFRHQIADAARLGARSILFDPSVAFRGEARQFAEFCSRLADEAGERMMPLCLAGFGEHRPVDHSNLHRWLKLTASTGPNIAPAGMPGAVRLHLTTRSHLSTLSMMCRELQASGYTQPLAIWPEPVVSLSELLSDLPQ